MKANKKRKKSSQKRSGLWQFVEYNIAGFAFFWSSYVTLLALDYFDVPLWISSSVSYLVGLTINFLLERYWVFKENRGSSAFAVATERYLVLSGVNLILNYVVLQSLTVLGVPLVIAPFISAGIFTPWNWLWYKYWVFAKTKKRRR